MGVAATQDSTFEWRELGAQVAGDISGSNAAVVSPESRLPSGGHPLRKIHGLVRAVLSELSRSFARFYAKEGRPSVPPERLRTDKQRQNKKPIAQLNQIGHF
jgi:hypothetical protein